jgi:transposase-like protein
MFFNHANGSTKPKAAGNVPVADIALAQTPPIQQQSAPVMPTPDPQVRPKATRRQFSTTYKLAILAETDACQEPGQIGALLRREGLYSSTLATFRKQRAEGHLQAKTDQEKRDQRREKLSTQQRDRRRLTALEKENQKLRLIIEVQKKLSTILEISLETPELTALREDIE